MEVKAFYISYVRDRIVNYSNVNLKTLVIVRKVESKVLACLNFLMVLVVSNVIGKENDVKGFENIIVVTDLYSNIGK